MIVSMANILHFSIFSPGLTAAEAMPILLSHRHLSQIPWERYKIQDNHLYTLYYHLIRLLFSPKLVKIRCMKEAGKDKVH